MNASLGISPSIENKEQWLSQRCIQVQANQQLLFHLPLIGGFSEGTPAFHFFVKERRGENRDQGNLGVHGNVNLIPGIPANDHGLVAIRNLAGLIRAGIPPGVGTLGLRS
jgi:hypothetical protein